MTGFSVADRYINCDAAMAMERTSQVPTALKYIDQTCCDSARIGSQPVLNINCSRNSAIVTAQGMCRDQTSFGMLTLIDTQSHHKRISPSVELILVWRIVVKLTPWLLTLVAFAVICLMAVTFFFKKLWATEVVQAPPIPARTMPMAITEIEPGTVITMKHIGNGPVGADAKLAPDTIRSLESLVGRIAKGANSVGRSLAGLNVLCRRRLSKSADSGWYACRTDQH
jgi:hypothetical protein